MSTLPLSPALRRILVGSQSVPPLTNAPSPTFDSPMIDLEQAGNIPRQLRNVSINPLDQLMNFEPETIANEEFRNLLHSFPQRKKPGFIDRLVGALSRNPENTDPEYFSNLDDWKHKIVPYQQAADNETQRNINRRTTAGLIASNRLKEQDLERKTVADEDRNTATNRRLDLMSYQNTIRAQVAKGGTITPDQDGSLYMVYKDGTKIPLDMTKTTPEFMEELKQSNRMEVIGARGAEARQTAETTKWSNPIQVYTKDGKPGPVMQTNLVTGEVRVNDIPDGGVIRPNAPGSNSSRPQSAADKQKEAVNKAQQARLKNPKWSDWITITGNNVVITKPNSTNRFNRVGSPDQITYNEIYKSIYGEDAASPLLKSDVPVTALKQLKAPDGEELVPLVNKSGKTVGVRKSMVEMALKQGYTKPGAK